MPPRTRALNTSPIRRRTRALAGTIAGAALVLAAPLAASAHIHVSPEESATGTSTRLDFTFSHGCDDSPTTAVVFTIPEGIDGVTPVLDGAWTISRELGTNGVPTQITYTAVSPVDTATAAKLSLDVIFASSAKGTDVAFPLQQRCVVGENDWSQVVSEGQSEDDLESPAPVVAVRGAAPQSEGDHHAAGAPDAAADVTTDSASLWLSGGALAAALAALGLAAATFARQRRQD